MAAGATAFLELTLTVMALYGVIVSATSQRTREIGVRVALGAQPASVIRLMMRDGLVLAGLGTAAGVGIALAAMLAIGFFTEPWLRLTETASQIIAARFAR